MKLSDYALASSTLKALGDLVSAKDKQVRGEMTRLYTDLYTESGIKSLDVLYEGAKVAIATLSIPKLTEPQVGDKAAYLAYISKHHPEWVQTYQPPPEHTVPPQVTKLFLDSLIFRSGEAFDPETGEVVPGVVAPHTPPPKSYSIRFAEGGDEALLNAWRTGRLAALDDLPALTGEDS